MGMFARFKEWLDKRRAARMASEAAWHEALTTDSDGITAFERRALEAIDELAGPLAIRRSGRRDRPTLDAQIGDTGLVLALWREDAQVSDAQGHTFYRAERWDFATPQESIEDLVAKVRANLGSNNRLERSRVASSVSQGGSR
jgi:hypothetical protein